MTPTADTTTPRNRWPAAIISGVIAYAALVVVHLLRDQPDNAAFQLGQLIVIPVAAVLFVGLLAGGTWDGRLGWPPVPIAVGVLVVSALGYVVMHVLPEPDDAPRGSSQTSTIESRA